MSSFEIAKKLKPFDFVIVALVLAASFFSFRLCTKKALSPKSKIALVSASEKEYVFPLSKDDIYRVQGEKGEAIIEVKSGKVRIADSACPNKTCVKCGFVASGKIICLPNKVFVSVENDDDEKKVLDAISQ